MYFIPIVLPSFARLKLGKRLRKLMCKHNRVNYLFRGKLLGYSVKDIINLEIKKPRPWRGLMFELMVKFI